MNFENFDLFFPKTTWHNFIGQLMLHQHYFIQTKHNRSYVICILLLLFFFFFKGLGLIFFKSLKMPKFYLATPISYLVPVIHKIFMTHKASPHELGSQYYRYHAIVLWPISLSLCKLGYKPAPFLLNKSRL